MGRITNRIKALEEIALPTEIYLLADNGEELSVKEWYGRRHELQMVRITQGDDLRDLALLFAYCCEEAGMLEEAEAWLERYKTD